MREWLYLPALFWAISNVNLLRKIIGLNELTGKDRAAFIRA